MAFSPAYLAASAVLALLACAMSQAYAETISGRAAVIDGETLEVRGTRIRLAGIDAQDDHVCERIDDFRWRCGQRARTALDVLLEEESIVACVGRERDPLGRLVATCLIGPIDLSLWLVRNGLALAMPASAPKYWQAQAEAKAARRGIWSER